MNCEQLSSGAAMAGPSQCPVALRKHSASRPTDLMSSCFFDLLRPSGVHDAFLRETLGLPSCDGVRL